MVPVLTVLEARVLAVLIEKEKTVPDSYPLSANTLMLGCNQKSARDPVLNVTESDVQRALDGLRGHALIVESSGGRVLRYAQNARRVFKLPEQSVALLAVLILRGPQTAAELRTNCDRLYAFGDISSVEAFLDELAEAEQPWVVKLPKLPGSREHRWAHLLSGPIDIESLKQSVTVTDNNEVASLRAEVLQLREELASLRTMVEKIRSELGIV